MKKLMKTIETLGTFLTGDNNTARLRKEVVEEDNVITTKGLYEHKLTGEDYISYLDDKYLPNYTITQPKTEFYTTFIKSGGVEFKLNQRFEQSGGSPSIVQGVQRNLAGLNNNDNIIFGWDNTTGEHYVEFNEINEASLLVTFSLEYAKNSKNVWNSKKSFWTLLKIIDMFMLQNTRPSPFINRSIL